MPAEWDFKCLGCSGLIFPFKTRSPASCPNGHDASLLQRVFAGPSFHKEMDAQYAPAVGRYVTNQRDFNDALKQASDVASEHTGMEHRYVPIDMADRDATGRTEE